jgi:arylsulfatase A-like enzyme
MENLDRRQFLSLAAANTVASTLMLTRCRTAAARGSDSPSKPPNIIFLLTDDHRADALGCAGNRIIKTPNLDDLAAGGVRFTNAFVTTSICAASRASILSGQYVRRHGIDNFGTSFSQENLAQTYPLLLRCAGYRIGFVGKYGIGRGDDFPADKYDFWRGCPGQCETYERKDKSGKYKHLTQIIGEQSVEFLQSCTQQQPFCLSVSFKAPHVQDSDPRQFIPDRAYQHLYDDVTIPAAKTADPKYFEQLPEFLRNSIARKRWQKRFSTDEKYQQSVKNYYRLIYGVDVVAGRIRAELKRLGLDKNTIIIFTGDNGFYLGEHGLAGKWFAHEESIRVPLIVYDPRAKQSLTSVTRQEMALNIDIAPTILELAGVEIPSRMQGRSLVPLLKGQKPKWRKDFFYEHLCLPKKIPQSIALRNERWKYTRYIDYDWEELYNLANDPHEISNLATDKKYEKMLKSMANRCTQLAAMAE